MTSLDDPTAPKTWREIVGTLLGTAVGVFFQGLLLMVLFSVLHASAHVVPAFGYWQSVFVVFVLAAIVQTGVTPLTARVQKLGKLVQVQFTIASLVGAILKSKDAKS